MMDVLIVSNSFPYPPYDGSKLALFNLIKNLAPRHDIDLIAFFDQQELAVNEEKIVKYCKNCDIVLSKERYSKFEKALFNLSWRPYIVVKKFSKRMNELVKVRISNKHYDIIHFDGFGMLPYGLSIDKIPRIAFVLDAVSLYFRRNIFTEKKLNKKLSYLSEFLKMKMYEKRLYDKFERCVVVSKVDKSALQRNCPGARISVVPVGVDTKYYAPTPGRERFPSILFSGNMDFPPNVHAVLWFVQNVWPSLKEKCSNLKFYIAGRNPSPAITRLRDDKQIKITGFVEDIRPFFDRTTVYVCPMISGAGMKNKLLEAMAMKKAIVASPLSIQGISDVEKENCLIIAKDPNEFTEQVFRLLENHDHRRQLESNARTFVKDNYSWKTSADKLAQVYQRTIYEYKIDRGKDNLPN